MTKTEIETYITTRNFPRLLELLESQELELSSQVLISAAMNSSSLLSTSSSSTSTSTGEPTGSSVNLEDQVSLYATLLVTYLIVNDLNSARHLLERIPDSIKGSALTTSLQPSQQQQQQQQQQAHAPGHPDILRLYDIYLPISENDYKTIYERLFDSTSSAQQTFTTPYIHSLLTILLQVYRERMCHWIANAYSIVSVERCCEYLGYTSTNMTEMMTELVSTRNWEHTQIDGKDMLKPIKPKTSGKQWVGLKEAEEIKNLVLHLESA